MQPCAELRAEAGTKRLIERNSERAKYSGTPSQRVEAEQDPAASLQGALHPVVSARRAAITEPAKIASLLRAIDGYAGQITTCCALRLAPLLFVRPGELRHAEWAEFDLDNAEWRIPAQKMKTRQAHIVPLPPQAVVVLLELRPLTGRGRFVFPSVRSPARAMSENTVNAALRGMGYTKENNERPWVSCFGFNQT